MKEYYFYLDRMLLPVTPSSLELKIANRNQTIDLANGGEINFLQPPGLTSLRFDLLLPSVPYPFAHYANGFQGADFYLRKLEKLKTSGKPFEFLVIRSLTGENILRYAAHLLEYSPDMANAVTGREDGRFFSKDAILRKNEMDRQIVRCFSDTAMTVSLEEYTIFEDAEKYGSDFFVSVSLKQYLPFGLKTLILEG